MTLKVAFKFGLVILGIWAGLCGSNRFRSGGTHLLLRLLHKRVSSTFCRSCSSQIVSETRQARDDALNTHWLKPDPHVINCPCYRPSLSKNCKNLNEVSTRLSLPRTYLHHKCHEWTDLTEIATSAIKHAFGTTSSRQKTVVIGTHGCTSLDNRQTIILVRLRHPRLLFKV